MKQVKTAGILAAALLALGGLATWDEWKTKKDDKQKESENKLVSFDPALAIGVAYHNTSTPDPASDAPDAAKATQTTLVDAAFTKKDGTWRITKPIDGPADSKAIDSLFTTVKDFKFDRVIAESKSEWAKFGLEAPRRSIVITLDGTPSTSITVLVGNNAPVGYFAYYATGTSDKVYLGSQYLAVSTNKTLHEFRDKSFVKIEEAALKSLTYALSGEAPIVFAREGGAYKITAPQALEADAVETRNFIDEIGRLQVAEFVDQPSPSLKAAFEQPKRYAAVTWTGDNGVATALSFTVMDGKFYASINPQTAAFRLNDDVKNKVTKKLRDFRNRKIFGFESKLISSVDVDGVTYKSVNDDWYTEEDAAKFDKDGKFIGRKEDKPTGKSQIRTLLVDFEFARAEDILLAQDPVSAKLTGAPKHRIRLTFREIAAKPPLTVDAWGDDKDETRLVLKHSASTNIFVVKKTLFEALAPVNPGKSTGDSGAATDPEALMDQAADLEASGLNN